MIRWLTLVAALAIGLGACSPAPCTLGEERDGGIGGTGGCATPEREPH